MNFPIRAQLIICLLIFIPVCETFSQESKNMRIALGKTPIQKGVDVDSVPADEHASCKESSSEKLYGARGFIITSPSGQMVRMYTRDDQGTHWTFFKSGNEVYRETDSDGDNKPNEYRWFNEAGSRVGVDANEDGVIDRWTSISAQEVAQEAFMAFKTRDKTRFLSLCVKNDDLQQLALGKQAKTKVIEKVNETFKGVEAAMANQKQIGRSTNFIGIGGSRPASIPSGKMGLEQDLTIFDNVSSLFQNGAKTGTIALGTLVKVGDAYRIVELPIVMAPGQTLTNGRLFELRDTVAPPMTTELQKLIAQYTQINGQLKTARGAAKVDLQQKRFDTLYKIGGMAKGEDQELWVKMLAADLGQTASEGEFRSAKTMLAKFAKDSELGDYRDLFAWELARLASAEAEDPQVRLEALEVFVEQFPNSDHSREAYKDLATFAEFDSSPDESALKWYKELATRFPETVEGRFAEGAIRRITSLDGDLEFTGSTFGGKKFDLNAYNGKGMVVLHFWSSDVKLSLDDFEELKRIRSKYEGEVYVIGVNLDADAEVAKRRVAAEEARWPQLWAPGGRAESPLGLQMGITSIPTTILIAKDGTVAENQISVAELDREIFRLKRREKKQN